MMKRIYALLLVLMVAFFTAGCTIEIQNVGEKEKIVQLNDALDKIINVKDHLNWGEGYDATRNFNIEFDNEHIREISVKNLVGKIYITQSDHHSVIISYTQKVKIPFQNEEILEKGFESIHVNTREVGDMIEVNVEMDKDIENLFQSRSVEFHISIPERIQNIDLTNSVGDLILSDIEVSQIKSNVSVGDLEIKRSKIEKGDFNTSTGGIDFSNTVLGGKISTSTGSITIEEGELLSDSIVKTSTGSIKMTASLEEGGNYTFHSKTGSITIYLDSDYSFQLDAETSVGKVECDLALKEIYTQKGILRGKAHDGKAFIELRSSVGSIKILNKN